jgi:hypothetical protein
MNENTEKVLKSKYAGKLSELDDEEGSSWPQTSQASGS